MTKKRQDFDKEKNNDNDNNNDKEDDNLSLPCRYCFVWCAVISVH